MRSAARHAPLDVVVAGLGRLGVELCRAARAASNVHLVGLVSGRGPEAARAVGEAARDLPVTDLATALGRPEVAAVLHGGAGDARQVAALFEQCARAGKDVVTSAALLHPMTELGATEAARLDAVARDSGARLLCTGVNPGLLLDALPAACATLAPAWNRLSGRRTVEAGAWGRGSLEHLGIGGPPAALEATVPLSLAPSLCLLAELLGVKPGDLHESRTAVTAEGAPDRAVGFVQRARARTTTGQEIELVWHAVVGLRDHAPEAAGGLTIAIQGANPLRVEMTGAFSDDPYPATATRIVRGAVAARSLAPGLLTVGNVPLAGR